MDSVLVLVYTFDEFIISKSEFGQVLPGSSEKFAAYQIDSILDVAKNFMAL